MWVSTALRASPSWASSPASLGRQEPLSQVGPQSQGSLCMGCEGGWREAGLCTVAAVLVHGRPGERGDVRGRFGRLSDPVGHLVQAAK